MMSSSSMSATPYKQVAFDMANTKKFEVDTLKNAGSVEAEVVIKHLREAGIQVSKSKDVGPSKNLVEALIDIIIQEIHGSPHEEDDWLDKLLPRRSSLVFLICIMCIFSLMEFDCILHRTNANIITLLQSIPLLPWLDQKNAEVRTSETRSVCW